MKVEEMFLLYKSKRNKLMRWVYWLPGLIKGIVRICGFCGELWIKSETLLTQSAAVFRFIQYTSKAEFQSVLQLYLPIIYLYKTYSFIKSDFHQFSPKLSRRQVSLKRPHLENCVSVRWLLDPALEFDFVRTPCLD